MIRATVISLIAICCFACGENQKPKEHHTDSSAMPFDFVKWHMQVNSEYPFREKMYKDLVYSNMLKKLNRQEIFALLGQPTRTDSLYLFYRVAENKIGLFTLHTTTVVIKLNEQDSVEKVLIHE